MTKAKHDEQPVAKRTRSNSETGALQPPPRKARQRLVAEPSCDSSSDNDDVDVSLQSRRRYNLRLRRGVKQTQVEADTSASLYMLTEALTKRVIPDLLARAQDAGTYTYNEPEEESSVDSSDDDDDSSDDCGDEEMQRLFKRKVEEQQYRKQLSSDERKELDGVEARLSNMAKDDIPLKYKILKANIPDNSKLKCLDLLQSGADDTKSRVWVNGMLRIPVGCYSSERGATVPPSQIAQALGAANARLDDAVYGHKDAKKLVLQLLAQFMANPKSPPPVIGLIGPPGIGKTTLARYGIADALNRPFSQVSCGGVHDAAALRGHNLAYEGSHHGLIVDMLIKCGCMDPVILLDEVDKMSTARGEDVASLLIHLLDPAQNMAFQDDHYPGVELDLSRAIFVLSMNDATSLSPILRDRINFVPMQCKAFEKVNIAEQHLVRKALASVALTPQDVHFPRETLQYIVRTCSEEPGVRGLLRALQDAIRQLNLLRLAPNVLDSDEKPKAGLVRCARKLAEDSSPFAMTIDFFDALRSEKHQERNKCEYLYI